MGILRSPKSQDKLETSVTKPISRQVDFAKLKPLKAGGMKRFTGFRDPRHEFTFPGNENDKKMKDDSDTDSEEDEDGLSHGVKLDQMDVSNTTLSSEDAKTQGELAEGVQKIKVKPPFSSLCLLLVQNIKCDAYPPCS